MARQLRGVEHLSGGESAKMLETLGLEDEEDEADNKDD